MPSPSIVLDGSQAYGSPTVTINGSPFKLNNINITRPVTEALRRDTSGRPQDQRMTADVATMTAEAQYPSTGAVIPIFGQTFTLTVDPAYGSETWIIDPQDYVADNGEGSVRVVPIKARKAINPGNVTTVA